MRVSFRIAWAWPRALALIAAVAANAGAQLVRPLDAVQALRLDSLVGPITVYYSAGGRDRARDVAAMLVKAKPLFRDSLGLVLEFHLALLNEVHWRTIKREQRSSTQPIPMPYGVPWVSDPPHVVFLPVDRGGAVSQDFASASVYARPADVAQLQSAGLSFDEAAHRMVDLIGFHELGHNYAQAMGISFSPKWLAELVATYFAYAYLSTTQPDQARLWDVMIRAKLAAPRPARTSLDYFEAAPRPMEPRTYNWYQAMFAQRVSELVPRYGFGFLRRVREAFPENASEKPSNEEALRRLDVFGPGFSTWAKQFAEIK